MCLRSGCSKGSLCRHLVFWRCELFLALLQELARGSAWDRAPMGGSPPGCGKWVLTPGTLLIWNYHLQLAEGPCEEWCGFVFLPLGPGVRSLDLLSCMGGLGVGKLHQENTAHMKGFCSDSWAWLMWILGTSETIFSGPCLPPHSALSSLPSATTIPALPPGLPRLHFLPLRHPEGCGSSQFHTGSAHFSQGEGGR